MTQAPERSDPQRRDVLAAAPAALAAVLAATPARAEGPLSDVPVVLPRAEFVYEALVDLDPLIALGHGPLGERRMVPIRGGVFAGPRIKGIVMPGGADRQLVRADGARLLNALYELKTDDGAVITVQNRVLLTKREDGSPYGFSHIELTAPEGPHGWLNNLVFVGTLHSLAPSPRVLIRVFALS